MSYARIPVGLALLALAGATGGLVLGMITRTARGHTGRDLKATPAEVTAYAALVGAAILRVTAALAPRWFTPAVCGAGVLWIVAFGLYAVRFGPWLMAPRVDGKDG